MRPQQNWYHYNHNDMQCTPAHPLCGSQKFILVPSAPVFPHR